MRVLGIDPGLVRTGWALVESGGSGAEVRAFGLVEPPAADELPARLADGAQQLRAILVEQRPELAVLEEIFTAPQHPRSALLMAHMRGVICLVVQEQGVPLLALGPTAVKQRLTGTGHASKQQIQRMVLRLTGLEPGRTVRSDVTDAIALALAGMHQALHQAANPLLERPRTRGSAQLRPHLAALVEGTRTTRGVAPGASSSRSSGRTEPSRDR